MSYNYRGAAATRSETHTPHARRTPAETEYQLRSTLSVRSRTGYASRPPRHETDDRGYVRVCVCGSKDEEKNVLCEPPRETRTIRGNGSRVIGHGACFRGLRDAHGVYLIISNVPFPPFRRPTALLIFCSSFYYKLLYY